MSLKFKDSAQREWDLKIHLGIVNRLRDANVIDLLRITENQMARYKKLMSDPCDLAGVAWEIVKPQAAAANVDFDEFMGALDGNAIDEMIETFARALADFIPALRNLILEGLKKGNEAKTLANKRAMAAVSKIDPAKLIAADMAAAELAIQKLMDSPGDASSGNAAQDSITILSATQSLSR